MISVIVPVYNTGQYLERVIESLLAQDVPRERYELIFVDNGSTDDSREILRRYPEIRLLEEPVKGSYAARNCGLGEARGDIIAFTDSDCYPAPGWLRNIEEGFRSSTSLVLMGPRTASTNNHSVRLVVAYENHKNRYICESDDPSIYCGYTNNMAVRRSAFDKVGMFIQRARGADTIFIQHLVKATTCNAVSWCPDMTVEHAEMESTFSWIGKVKTYSRSHRAFRHIAPVRPLSTKERIRIFRKTVKRRPVLDSAWLMSLLVTGQLAWWLGGLGVAESDH